MKKQIQYYDFISKAGLIFFEGFPQPEQYIPTLFVFYTDGTYELVKIENVETGIRDIVCLSNEKDLVVFPREFGVEAFII